MAAKKIREPLCGCLLQHICFCTLPSSRDGSLYRLSRFQSKFSSHYTACKSCEKKRKTLRPLSFLDQISGSVFGRDGVPHTAAECVAHPEDRDACHRVGGVLLDLLEGADALELGDEVVVIVFHDCSFDWLISII